MKTKLKVYGWNHLGISRRIIATTSWKNAAEISGESLHYIRKYGSITGNKKEIEIATSKPNTIFETKDYRKEYVEVK